jgi:MinD-like ATPase involved in chromosome partitioning or flagellar assembly
MLVVDTPSGINDDTLVTVASADSLVAVMRLDKRDCQGTSVILDLPRRLKVPRLDLVVYQVWAALDPAATKAGVTRTHGCEVAAALPSSPRLMSLGSGGISVLHYPYDHLTGLLWQHMSGLADADKDFLAAW